MFKYLRRKLKAVRTKLRRVHTHTHTHKHTPKHTRQHTHPNTHTNARTRHAPEHKYARSLARTYARACETYARTFTRAHARTFARTLAHQRIWGSCIAACFWFGLSRTLKFSYIAPSITYDFKTNVLQGERHTTPRERKREREARCCVWFKEFRYNPRP